MTLLILSHLKEPSLRIWISSVLDDCLGFVPEEVLQVEVFVPGMK